MSKKRILVIDDEVGITQMIKLNLEETGAYEVREENKAVRGLAAGREFNPDLILLDVIMPEQDGGEVAEQIKADESLKSIPIVFLTAVVSKEETDARGGLIGGHPFIAKPVSTEEVIQCIEKHLGK